MALTDLSDDQLLANLQTLCGRARSVLARIIAYLAEVDERRTYLKIACSSLFDFCVTRLEMSEGEAFRRMAVARLVRRFPSLLGRIERGEIHLSGLVLLRHHLTLENHEELVSAASRKTTRKIQELIAARFPKPDVRPKIRQLPTPNPKSSSPSPSPSPSPSSPPLVTSDTASDTQPLLLSSQPSTNQLPTRTPIPTTPINCPNGHRPAPQKPARIEPLSATRHVLRLTISTELRDNIEHAKQLMRHRNPNGDLEVVMDRAFKDLVANLKKERLGETARPQKNLRPARPDCIRASTRREVFERDGEQCSYVDEPTGQRCPSRTFLEIDHVHARALDTIRGDTIRGDTIRRDAIKQDAIRRDGCHVRCGHREAAGCDGSPDGSVSNQRIRSGEARLPRSRSAACSRYRD